jgi:hypothetical protein
MGTFSHPDTVGRYGEEKSEIFEAILRNRHIFCDLFGWIHDSLRCAISSFS